MKLWMPDCWVGLDMNDEIEAAEKKKLNRLEGLGRKKYMDV